MVGLITDLDRSHDTFATSRRQKLTGIIGRLDGFVDDTVDDSQSVEVQSHSWDGAVADLLIVLIESIKECRAVVLETSQKRWRSSWRGCTNPSVALRGQVEFFLFAVRSNAHFRIKLWQSAEEAL